MKLKTQALIIKAHEYVNNILNENGNNLKLNNIYGNAIMNWMRMRVKLKFTLAHMNFVLVETWDFFKLSNAFINNNNLEN